VENNNELREIIKAKDTFLSIIAHDLRSPFNAILGFLQILLDEHEKYNSDEFVKIIKILNESANQTFELLENLLTWSLIQKNGIKYSPENLEFKKVLYETISGLQVLADKKNIRISHVICEYDLIFADKNMLTLILRNLISNAIKFSNTDCKVIISTCENVYGNFLEIAVSDEGVGIPKDEIGNLFHIDKKNSKEGTAKEKGTGLGLILCKEFVEKHDGMIWVESELGKGSIFSFTIPFSK